MEHIWREMNHILLLLRFFKSNKISKNNKPQKMFKKTDNIVFDRINQMKDVMEPVLPLPQIAPHTPAQSEPPSPPSPPSSPSPPSPPSSPSPSSSSFPEVHRQPVTNLNLQAPPPPAVIPSPPKPASLLTHQFKLTVQPPNIKTSQSKQTEQKDVDQFKQVCKQWLALNDDIKKLQQAIKVRRQFQSELTPKMMVFMKEKQIEDLDTGDGKLKYKITNRKLPLNKDNIQKKLTEYFKDKKQAESVATYLIENRDIVKSERLSRTVKSQKKPKINPNALKLKL